MGKEGKDNKRRRSSNFTPEEKKLLIHLVGNYAYIIESKKTDSVNWKEKETAWKNLADDFNSRCPSGIFRSMDSLKKFYENQKKAARKDLAEERLQILRTGSGLPVPPKPRNDTQELLLSIMNEKTVSGVLNPFDSDHVIPEILYEQNNRENSECEDEKYSSIEEGVAEEGWGNFSASYLQTTLHEELGSKVESSASNNTETSNKSNRNWVNQRVIKPSSTPNISDDYRELAKLKLELVKVQLDIAKAQLKSNEQEFKLKLENLEIENQMKKLQFQLLQKQL